MAKSIYIIEIRDGSRWKINGPVFYSYLEHAQKEAEVVKKICGVSDQYVRITEYQRIPLARRSHV